MKESSCDDSLIAQPAAPRLASWYEKVQGLVLREKDMDEAEYERLARQVLPICKRNGVPLIVHTYVEVARRLREEEEESSCDDSMIAQLAAPRLTSWYEEEESSCDDSLIAQPAAPRLASWYDKEHSTGNARIGLHLPIPILEKFSKEELKDFSILGASCHSLEQVQKAQEMGCTYVTAGHVFETDCKKGVPPRGIPFLKEICEQSRIRVYALGGMNPENAPLAMEAGAYGVAYMSGVMIGGRIV